MSDVHMKLAQEVLWLQGKFKELLEQQQSVLATLSDTLKRVDTLEYQMTEGHAHGLTGLPICRSGPVDDEDIADDQSLPWVE